MIPALTRRAFRLLSAAPVPGALTEFGVYQGAGLISMAQLAEEYLGHTPPLYGFDTFEGMPPSAVDLSGPLAQDWATGTFADTSIGDVRARLSSEGVEATLVQGKFSDVGALADHGIEKVMFAHIDADLYEGYRDALELLTPHLQVGSVLLFDESVPPNEWSMQSIRDHGWRAVREWEDRTGFNLLSVRSEWTVALCVIVDEDYLRDNWRVIDDLRKDGVTESLKNIAKKALGRYREARAF